MSSKWFPLLWLILLCIIIVWGLFSGNRRNRVAEPEDSIPEWVLRAVSNDPQFLF
jgi:hypothetical protein